MRLWAALNCWLIATNAAGSENVKKRWGGMHSTLSPYFSSLFSISSLRFLTTKWETESQVKKVHVYLGILGVLMTIKFWQGSTAMEERLMWVMRTFLWLVAAKHETFVPADDIDRNRQRVTSHLLKRSDTDRNLPWQHFIATSKDAIVSSLLLFQWTADENHENCS